MIYSRLFLCAHGDVSRDRGFAQGRKDAACSWLRHASNLGSSWVTRPSNEASIASLGSFPINHRSCMKFKILISATVAAYAVRKQYSLIVTGESHYNLIGSSVRALQSRTGDNRCLLRLHAENTSSTLGFSSTDIASISGGHLAETDFIAAKQTHTRATGARKF